MKTQRKPRSVWLAIAVTMVGLSLTPTIVIASGSGASGIGRSPHVQTAAHGVLTIQGNTNNVLNLNPFVGGDLGVDLVYNSLELLNPVNASLAPELATSFTATSATTLVYTIRSGVKWSNGKAFTPADVVGTFKLLKKFPALDTGGVWSVLKSVSAAGNKVIFRLKTPDVPLRQAISGVPIVPNAIWSHVSNPATFANTHPVGTGPYTLKSYAPTKTVFVRVPTAFEARNVRPENVAFVAGPSTGAANQLLIASGAYDFAYDDFPNVKTAFVGQNPKHNVYWFPPGGVISLFMNLTKAPFNNVDFRLGMSYAINRSAVENAALFGLEGVAPQTGAMLPGQASWTDPTIPNKGLITQNTKLALSYFNKAGYTQQNGKLVNAAGTQVGFNINCPLGWTDWNGAATEIATELNALGMNVTTNFTDYTGWANGNANGTYDANIDAFGGTGSAYSTYNPQLNSIFDVPVNTPANSNIEHFSSPIVNHYLAGLAAARTTAAQMPWIHALTDVMYNQVPLINLYYGGMWGLFSTRHWVGWPSAKDPYTTPATWNYDLLAIVMHVTPVK